jgi:hypothetical protein
MASKRTTWLAFGAQPLPTESRHTWSHVDALDQSEL